MSSSFAKTLDSLNPPPDEAVDSEEGLLTSDPQWRSGFYLSNYLAPAFSPSEWFNTNTPSSFAATGTQPLAPIDYFLDWDDPYRPLCKYIKPSVPNSAATDLLPGLQTLTHLDLANIPCYRNTDHSVSGPSALYPPPIYPQEIVSISASSLGSYCRSRSPSSLASGSARTSPLIGVKRKASSMESEGYADHEVPSGVDRDGLMWGIPVDQYRALSVRERKRLRNRISARTFRAKRKERLTSLESTLDVKDKQIRMAQNEAAKLRQEVEQLRQRLASHKAR